ncbi:MAG: indolepyruvate ferredoxin oxidoreductase family protein [Candidatus Methylacidiphilales bacterium]
MKVDPRFLKEEGQEVFTGNELLVKGLLETEGGSHLWTGYPGSPIAGFFDCIESIAELPRSYGIHAFIANNEALAAAALNGSQMAGLRAIAAMKSVGVHVASDALALGNLAGAHPEGGALVVLGDDPWNDSTQVPSDSRFLCKHMHMPVLEPGTLQEVKDWIDAGFKLSSSSELYIGYLISTALADGGASVQTRRNHFPHHNTLNPLSIDTAKLDLEKSVLLPPRTSVREANFPDRYRRLWAKARQLGVDRVDDPGTAPVAFITSAVAYTYLRQALAELGLAGRLPILKLGITYPIDPAHLHALAAMAPVFCVVEERRGFLEEQVTLLASQGDLPVKVVGKVLPGQPLGIPSDRGLNPSLLVERLGPWLRNHLDPDTLGQSAPKIDSALALIADTASFNIQLAPRTPTFCPGCPHRDSASVLVEIKKDFADPDFMTRRHRRAPVDLVFHGDTGCYTMLMFEPTKDLMHNYSGMGLGGGTGMGIDPFITNKQVVFMGDSTFFHSGQVAISNSVKNGQDITYIILDNKTTAMTGHQPTPGVEQDLLGNTTFTQSIDKIIEAMTAEGRVAVVRVNPALREHYRSILEETILQDGVKVLIADKECGITYHRRIAQQERAVIRNQGFLPRKTHINITPEVCEYCLECTVATGCPGLTFTETDLGRKIQTDLSWCVADTACTKLHACPSFEEAIVVRDRPPEKRLPDFDPAALPAPKEFIATKPWHVYLAGVGGMGIATSTATLVRAAHRQGYRIQFAEKNGLAIRNGGVYSQITFLPTESHDVSPIIPYGHADLILGVDLLEAARGLDPKGHQRVGHPSRTAAVINTVKTPTILSLLGKDDFCVDEVEAMIRPYTRPNAYFSANISAASEHHFGTKLYANVMMIGAAYQAGLLPLTLDNIQWGIKETMPRAFNENWLAFNLGRKIIADQAHAAPTSNRAPTYHDILAEKSDILRAEGPAGQRLAQALWRLSTQALERIKLDPESQRHLVLRIYELIRYEDVDLAQHYIDRVSSTFQKDSANYGYAITKAVLWNAHRVTAIKDEVWVAHLLTSEEKHRRDRERYNVNPALGDRIIYRHLNRPEFIIAGLKIRFKLKTSDWMLRIMARLKILRRLLPGWHRQEREFRDWFLNLIDEFSGADDASYPLYVELFRLPEKVTGYREVRYPKMAAARARAAELLAQIHGKQPAHAMQVHER